MNVKQSDYIFGLRCYIDYVLHRDVDIDKIIATLAHMLLTLVNTLVDKYVWDDDTILTAYRTQPHTTQELAKIILGDDATFDTALPHSWYSEFLACTGVNPFGMIVWYYPKAGDHKISGRPVPLTDFAVAMLDLFNRERA